MKTATTITTLIGLTEEEVARARQEYDHEMFQLEEITRHYEERMRRRDMKRDIVRKLAFAADITADYDLWKRRWAKLDELNAHHERDLKRWYAGTDRKIALSALWREMVKARQAMEKSA